MDYSLWLRGIFGKNRAEKKNNYKSLSGHYLKAPFMLTTMAQSPASYLIHHSANFSSKSIPNSYQFWFVGPFFNISHDL